MSDTDETELRMARRNIREGAERIARQREALSGLRPGSEVATIARALLAELEEAQKSYEAHLERLLGHD